MKKLSANGLIDLVALNRVLDKAESVVWAYDDGYHYISDAHMAVKIRMTMKDSTALRALFGRFHGELPKAGTALRSIAHAKGYEVDTIPMDGLKRCLETEALVPLEDTRMMYEMEYYNRVARVFRAYDDKNSTYIFVNTAFPDCVRKHTPANAVKADKKSLLKFTWYDEVAVILPIVMDKPKYMVSPQVLDLN